MMKAGTVSETFNCKSTRQGFESGVLVMFDGVREENDALRHSADIMHIY